MFKKFAVISVLLITMAGLAQDEHKKATELYQKGQYKDALVLLEEAITAYPDWYYPTLLKGQCNLKLGNFKEALASFNDVLTLELPSTDVPKVKYYIAQCYMKVEDYPKAIHAYNELIPITPDSKKFDVFMNRGQAEMQIAKEGEDKNDLTKANSYFSKSVVSFTEALKYPAGRKDMSIEALFQKAYSQYKIGNFKGGINSLESSIQAFKDVIAENPKEKRAHTFLINLSFQIVDKVPKGVKDQKYEDVVGYIERYLTHWPGDVKMINRKGLALQGAKKYTDAIKVFKSIIELTPNDGQAWFSLGSCQMADKQYPTAIETFNKAKAKGEKENPSIYTYTAYCYQQQKSGCDKEDIPLYEKSVAVLEEGVNALKGQGKAEIQQDLDATRKNLIVHQENLATDNQNHRAALDNIKNLQGTISSNRSTLAKNQDLFLQQPTDELRAAIEQGKKALNEDEAALNDQFKLLDDYIKAAQKCGGAASFTNYAEMVATAKSKGQ